MRGLLCYLPGTRGPGLPEYVIGYFGFIFGLGIRTNDLWGVSRASLAEFAGRAGIVLGYLLYFTLCEARGQTPGKRMVEVRVVRADRGRWLEHRQALVRSLSFVLTLIPLGVGQLAILWDPQRRRPHGQAPRPAGGDHQAPQPPQSSPLLITAALDAGAPAGCPGSSQQR